ncbi:MAG TPA: cation:proton antiporter [Gemmatimonadaceae bacterium]|jgi:Kef-type K+ transport system membrane component KefB|nr:cation:proton antiporter [Gemmatimonadaceae bacterium]
MQSNVWLVAAAWMALALLASLISIRVAVSVALIEIVIGVIAGNFLDFHTTPWIDFLATFGSGLLTFLAGAEIEPESLRKHLKPALAIGSVSFFAPFLLAMAFARWIAHWDLHASEIAGIALSTTSVAVVYATMLETGLNRTDLGRLILAACFVTDFGTVLALGVLFANFNGWLALFVAVTAIVLWYLPRVTRFVIRSGGKRVSEPEVKFMFLVLFLLGGLAQVAKSEAVLPAYLVGLVIAGVFVRDRMLMDRMRAIAFAMLTPFYFIKAGLFVSLPAVATGALLIVALLTVKIAAKVIGVWPMTRVFHFDRRDGAYTTLLMSTGLTFGTISALFGLTNHLITQAQYTVLVTVVIASAVVPTLIAQWFFQPGGATSQLPVMSIGHSSGRSSSGK